jgi:hypothetical protein
MLWLWNSLTIGGTWTTTNASSTGYPVTNIGTFLASDVWRSGIASATENVQCALNQTVAFNSALFPTFIVLKDHNLDTTVTGNVTFTLSNAGSNPVMWTWTPTAGPSLIAVPAQGANSYNRLNISFTKTAAGTVAQLGKVFCGPTTETAPTGDFDWGNYSKTFAERTQVLYSLTGQRYAAARAQYETISLAIPMATETIEALHRTIFKTVGTFRPFFLVPVNGATTTALGAPKYLALASTPTESLIGFGADYLWALSLDFEEQL